jgi:AcrR family transcriptional regulator
MAVKLSRRLRAVPGVRPPRQKRGQASLDRLLDAAEALLAEQGMDGFSIAALSQRSGLSNGAIYWRVDSLESLFVAVHERLIDRLRSEHYAYDDPARWTGLSVEEFVANAVRMEADIFRRHAAALRILALSTATDAAASARGTHAVRDTEHRFRDHVKPRLQADGCSDPAIIAITVFRVAFGALINRITWPDQQADPPIPWQRFVDDLCHMTSAYAADHCHSTRATASSTRQRRGRPQS